MTWSELDRLGLLFVEVGQTPRPSATLYDRGDSAFATLDPDAFDWSELLDGARAFHTSGITPALSAACERATGDALHAARAAGVHTSFDLNFRGRLTTPAGARRCRRALAPAIDTLIASVGEVELVFGLVRVAERRRGAAARRARDPRASSSPRRIEDPDGLQRASQRARRRRGRSSANRRSSATVDPLGGGDAFSAGFLLGLLEHGPGRGLELAARWRRSSSRSPATSRSSAREEVEHLLARRRRRTRR